MLETITVLSLMANGVLWGLAFALRHEMRREHRQSTHEVQKASEGLRTIIENHNKMVQDFEAMTRQMEVVRLEIGALRRGK